MSDLLARLRACIPHLDAAGLAKLAELLELLDPFLRDATELELRAGKLALSDFRSHPPPPPAPPVSEVVAKWARLGALQVPTPRDGSDFLRDHLGMLPSSDMQRPGVRW